MRCSHCGTLYEYANGTCPLCGAPCEVQPTVHPPRVKKVHHYIVPFSAVYFGIALAVTLVLGIINAIYVPQVHFWAIVVASLWYVYFTLRRTVLGTESLYFKILGQSITLLFMLLVIAEVMQAWVIYEWVMPIFWLVGTVIATTFGLISPQKARRHLASLFFQSLLSAAILLACLARELFWIPATVCGALGLVSCVTILFTSPREFWSQIRRTFDN